MLKPAPWRKLLLCLALPVLGAAVKSGRAMAADDAPQAQAPQHHAAHHSTGSTLEERVQALSRALDLDTRQQTRLRKVLEGQREEVAALQRENSVAPVDRIVALRVISDHTADQIRALLNDEQRQKYNLPRQRRQDAASQPDVAAWMDAMGPHVPAPPSAH